MTPALGNAASLASFLPELLLCGGIIVVLGVGLLVPWRPAPSRSREGLFLFLTLAALAASALSTALGTSAPDRALFGGLMARDAFGDYFKRLFAAAGAIVALCAYRSSDIRGLGAPRPGGDTPDPAPSARDAPLGAEWSALLLSIVLGCNWMASATDLLMAYLGVEFVSILSYVATGLSRAGRRSSEAALKYAIYGGAATGAMLYGFSLLFGLAGSTDLTAVRAAVVSAPPLTVAVAGALCLAGFAFKMAVVPFHMWCPDVYQGAPTPVAALLSIAPKAAGFALAFRFLIGGAPLGSAPDAARWLAGTGPAGTWTLVIAALAAATMTLGNLAALAQTDMKRLLAYSSIAHAGTLLMALAVGDSGACEAMLLYLGIYLFMNMAAFLVVIAVAEGGEGESLVAFTGLGRRAPFATFCLVVALFSLTGLPPTAGFVAKYAIFAAVIRRAMDGGGAPLYVLGIVGVLNTVVSLVYYARVIRVMVLDRPTVPAAEFRVDRLHTALLAVATTPVVVLGIYARPLADLAARSVGLWSP